MKNIVSSCSSTVGAKFRVYDSSAQASGIIGDVVYLFRLTGLVTEVTTNILGRRLHQTVAVSVPQSHFDLINFDYFDEAFEQMRKALKEKLLSELQQSKIK